MDVNEHPCPLCAGNMIPTYRAMCLDCFNRTPWKTRADYLHAYWRRTKFPAEWEEQYAAVKQMFNDKTAGLRPGAGGEDATGK